MKEQLIRVSFARAYATAILLIGIAVVFVTTPVPAADKVAGLVVLGILTVGTGATFLLRTAQRDDAVQAVLTTTAPWLAGAFAVLVVGLYLLGQTAGAAVTLSAIATLSAWVVAGLLFRRHASAAAAQPRNYAALLARHARLEADHSAVCSAGSWPGSPDQQTISKIACGEIADHLKAVSTTLGVPGGPIATGIQWTAGTGYIDLWNRIHRGEEALLSLAPLPTVLAGAFHDRLRMNGSNIGNAGELSERLDVAVKKLTEPSATELEKSAARSDLRVVRCAINSYRDDLWDGIVRVKNRLLKTMIFTGLTADIALVLALVMGADQSVIVGATTFYLVGALIGLFNRLRTESEASSVVEDYGLSDARLIATPLASGLAAIAGVVLTAKVLFPTSDVLAPATPDQPSAATAAQVREPASLSDIFDLERNPGGLILAAMFGLTPGLVFDRIQGQTEKYKSDLRASGATDSKPKT